MEVEIANQVGAQDFSILAMFLRASLVVKLVMIGLAAASVLCWAIVFEKFAVLGRTRRAIDRFEELFWSGQSLDEIYAVAAQGPRAGTAALFLAAMDEWRRSQQAAARAGVASLVQRIEKVMDVELQRETARLEQRLLVLATVGSVSPFIGLFGTVWGIMNSFQAIAVSKNTNLAVVAPGLAEALFATALGLLAAIPAVIFYNKFSHDISRLGTRMENFIEEFTAILQRQLEEAY
ncbi:MAG TPA: protein TolQ [Thermopetrobacter sp.]|nr:protein TolQ [Thermopetrobacter sp.]